MAYCGADHVSSLKPGKMVLPGGTGRERRELMEPFTYCKLEIFIPETHLKALQKALQEVDAGHIGKYDKLYIIQSGDRLLEAAGRQQPVYR